MAKRADARAGFTTPVRLRLLEDDVDDVVLEMASMNDRLGKILWALVGVLISVATSAILLGLNLALGR